MITCLITNLHEIVSRADGEVETRSMCRKLCYCLHKIGVPPRIHIRSLNWAAHMVEVRKIHGKIEPDQLKSLAKQSVISIIRESPAG